MHPVPLGTVTGAQNQDASFVDSGNTRRERRLGIESIVVGRQRRNRS